MAESTRECGMRASSMGRDCIFWPAGTQRLGNGARARRPSGRRIRRMLRLRRRILRLRRRILRLRRRMLRPRRRILRLRRRTLRPRRRMLRLRLANDCIIRLIDI